MEHENNKMKATAQNNLADRPLPQGLLMALSQNMQAMKQYAALSDAGRERLIERAAAVRSREQMRSLVDQMSQFL